MDLFHLSLKKCFFESKTYMYLTIEKKNIEVKIKHSDSTGICSFQFELGSCPTGREDEEGCPQSGILSPAVFGAYLSMACPTHLYC